MTLQHACRSAWLVLEQVAAGRARQGEGDGSLLPSREVSLRPLMGNMTDLRDQQAKRAVMETGGR